MPPPPDSRQPRGWFTPIDHDPHFIAARPVRWGIGDAVLGLLIAHGMVVAGVIVVALLLGQGNPADGFEISIVRLLAIQGFMWAGYVGWMFFVGSSRGNGIVADFGWKFRPADIYQGLLIGVAAQLLVILVMGVLVVIFEWWRPSESASDLADLAIDPLSGVLLVLMVVVGAPIVEELFFRGLLLRSLERRWGTTVAVVVSSVVFAVVHFDPMALPGHLIFGFLAAWLTVRTGRLGPAIWAHVGFNAFTVVVLLVIA